MSDSYLHEGFINDAKGALKRWGGGGSVKLQDITLTENGEYKADKGYNGFGTVTVDVPEEEPVLQDKTITENGEYTADVGYDGLGKVTVDVAGSGGIASGVSWDAIDANGWYKKATVYGDAVPRNAFSDNSKLESVSLPTNLKSIYSSAFAYCSALQIDSLPDSVTKIASKAFLQCSLIGFAELPPQLVVIESQAFQRCAFSGHLFLPASLMNLGSYAFNDNTALISVTFSSKPTLLDSSAFYNCTNITVINVPWAEGAVSGAPWGATKATINYNYTGA